MVIATRSSAGIRLYTFNRVYSIFLLKLVHFLLKGEFSPSKLALFEQVTNLLKKKVAFKEAFKRDPEPASSF